eukprot:2700698-Amphidinium_carterae.1
MQSAQLQCRGVRCKVTYLQLLRMVHNMELSERSGRRQRLGGVLRPTTCDAQQCQSHGDCIQ